MPLITDVFNWIQLETFSFSSNLDGKMSTIVKMKVEIWTWENDEDSDEDY